MTQHTDGRYDHTKPWSSFRSPINPDAVAKKYSYYGPWATNQERLTSQALMVMNVPGADIQAMVRPPLPQIQLFPARYGYGDRSQPGIDDIVTVDRNYTEPRVSWFSGGVSGYQAAERNALGSN